MLLVLYEENDRSNEKRLCRSVVEASICSFKFNESVSIESTFYGLETTQNLDNLVHFFWANKNLMTSILVSVLIFRFFEFYSNFNPITKRAKVCKYLDLQ